jgi:hypothetical protein
MRTLAVEIDESVLEKAELKARALDTSVAEIVTDYLQNWTAENPERTRLEEAREELKARFAKRDWQFAVGTPDDREQRNARR